MLWRCHCHTTHIISWPSTTVWYYSIVIRPAATTAYEWSDFGSSHFNALDNNRIGQPLESRNHTGQTSSSSSHAVVEPAHIQADHYPSGIDDDDDYTIFDISAANVSTIEIDCRPIYNVNWRKHTSNKRVTTIQLPQTIPPTYVSRSGLCTVDDSNKREGGSNNSRQQNTYQT